MIERSGSGSVPLTNGCGSESRRVPKNPDPDPQHWILEMGKKSFFSLLFLVLQIWVCITKLKIYFFYQETRIKFPDQPERFMESEMELHDALQGRIA
jgi:hypothetical protein